jgi:uncharacterized repeat protein (TIGR01451 family)
LKQQGFLIGGVEQTHDYELVVTIEEVPPPAADLSITLTASGSVRVFDTLTYRITVTNNGPAAASGITVTDTLPPGVDFLSALNCLQAGRTVTCKRDSIFFQGEVVEFEILVIPTPAAAETITNIASVKGNDPDPDTSNNTAIVNTQVTPLLPADLAIIALTSSAEPVEVGTPLTYTVELINNGPGVAFESTLTISLPAGVTFVSSPTGCSAVQGTVTCPVGNTGGGSRSLFQIVVIPRVVGTITTSVQVTSTTPDPNPANNTGTIVTTVVPVVSQQVADLAFVRDASSPNPVTVGTPLTYSLIFVNNGPDIATDLTVIYTLPIDIDFVSAVGCQQNGRILTCSFGSIIGVGTLFGSTIVVIPTVPGTITATAQATSRTPDPNPANNVGTVVTTVLPVDSRGSIQ